MKRRKRVTRRRKRTNLGKASPGIVSLNSAAEKPKPPYASIEQVLGLYKPLKRLVTLRLDADVVAWFKKPGEGYQTRINRALRKVMREERRKAEE
jgi:uncharacterized protein (DUF4415 family)